MRRESPDAGPTQEEDREKSRRKEALDVLIEARERLLARMTEDVLSNRDIILEGSAQDGLTSFELEEIEDRYSARLNSLNALLENLEYRRPVIKHRIETLTTTSRTLQKDLGNLLSRFEQWDLVDVDLSRLEDDQLLVVVAFTADEYPE
ncbi:MAG TPA: hypothetical protein VMT52_12390 [Planctomycetota bacterium]|nr:hypothetical protein [Planctomycetota bacterium]